MQKDPRRTIHGIVIPDAWDDSGHVVALAVFTFQEEKIRIVDDERGRTLKLHLRQRVTVDGEMFLCDQAPSLRVHRYRVDKAPP